MNKTFLKHMIAALIAVLASYIGSASPVNLVYILIFSVGFVATYSAQNAQWPSVSPIGFINVWDLLKGLILAVGAALSDLAAQWITTKVVDWHILWITVSTAVVAYVLSKFGFGPKKAEVNNLKTVAE